MGLHKDAYQFVSDRYLRKAAGYGHVRSWPWSPFGPTTDITWTTAFYRALTRAI